MRGASQVRRKKPGVNCRSRKQEMPEGPQELRSAFARSSQDVVKPKNANSRTFKKIGQNGVAEYK